jgi:hypothetical protein
MLLAQAAQAINAINFEKIKAYKDYWESIAPKNKGEYFWRWIFSFLSVHTTWSANVRAFTLLKSNEDWIKDDTLLSQKIKESGVGLHIRRTAGIAAFTKAFWANPEEWEKKDTETWIQCRNRLAQKCVGLGYAKTAFALEMCYPTLTEAVCLDTHMLQLYGYNTSSEKRKGAQYNNYQLMEEHWTAQCKLRDIPAYIGRTLFWDAKQQKEDSKYWSYVLE